MTESGIRLALVGYGAWGAVLARALARNPRFTSIDFVSGNPAVAVDFPGSRVFPSLAELLAETRPDGVVIATEPARHAAACLQCLEHDVPSFVEKPLALSIRDVEQVRDVAARRGIGVHVDYVHRHNPAFRGLVAALPRITPLREIRSEGGGTGPVRDGYSALWDYGPHDASMMLAVTDGDPVVTGCVSTASNSGGATFEVTFQAGAITGLIRVSSDLPEKTRRFSVRGDGGTLVYDDLSSTPLTLDGDPIAVERGKETPLDIALARFADMIEAGGAQSLFLDDSVAVTAFLAAAERAAA